MADKRFHRRSIRLPEYDYTGDGAYFVTICTWHKKELFGTIIDHKMIVNEWGHIVRDEWLQTENIRAYVELDEFIVMPDHFHGIIHLDNATPVGATRRVAPTTNGPRGPKPHSLGAIIGQFKSVVTKRINQYRKNVHSPIWQRNYFERVIRNDYELARIRQYIRDNPICWPDDEWGD